MITIDKSNWQSEVLTSNVPVLVDFWAEWCGPCRAIAPILEQIGRERGDSMKIAKVNVDELPELAGQFGIRSIPTLLLFKDGAVKAQMVGLMGKPQLDAKLDSLVG